MFCSCWREICWNLQHSGKWEKFIFFILFWMRANVEMARISSGMRVFILCVLYLLLLLCVPSFFSALGGVAGLGRCYWAGRTSQPVQCWALGLFCPLRFLSCFSQIWCLSFSGDRKPKLVVKGDSKRLCTRDCAGGKTSSQSLLSGYGSGLRCWLQRSQFHKKCASDLSAQAWGSSGCSDLSLLAHRQCSETL